MKLIFSLSLTLLLMACNHMPSPYRIDIEQGTPIESEKLAQVKPGMTQEEVIYLLGQPAIHDYFHANRFDYLYELKKSDGTYQKEHVVIYFEGDRVKQVVRG